MKYHECGNSICNNLVEEHFWLCFYCWEKRESNEEYKFSQYTPKDLKKITRVKK